MPAPGAVLAHLPAGQLAAPDGGCLPGWPATLPSRGVAPAATPALTGLLRQLEAGEAPESIDISYTHVHSQGARLLGTALARGGPTHADLTSCYVGDEGAGAVLAAAAAEGGTLRSLNLCSNGLVHPAGVAHPLEAGCLRALGLGHNSLSGAAVRLLCAAAGAKSSCLTELDLSATGCLHSAPGAVGQLLQTSAVLQVLRLGQQGAWPEHEGMAVLRGLAANKSLLALDLRDCGLGAPGAAPAAELCAAVSRHPRLAKLNLRGNAIGPAALAAVSPAFGASRSLRELNLSANPLAGVQLLPPTRQRAEGVKGPKARPPRSGRYCDKGLVALAAALKANRGMQMVDISECALACAANPFYDGSDHGGVGWVADSLKRSFTLRVVDASRNMFNDETVEDLVEVSGGRMVLAREELHSDIAAHLTPCHPIALDERSGRRAHR
eukprot:TRINITY_DN13638_c0_g1_i1.p1 TRINITY_DN13638_c0_g1~~TRINITY_DN13638_c0_g1_i1.p1  ORF type:complete len:439 (+),score=98.69 TRINITY_DN13638_c0_g1_i1:91-1407(+)